MATCESGLGSRRAFFTKKSSDLRLHRVASNLLQSLFMLGKVALIVLVGTFSIGSFELLGASSRSVIAGDVEAGPSGPLPLVASKSVAAESEALPQSGTFASDEGWRIEGEGEKKKIFIYKKQRSWSCFKLCKKEVGDRVPYDPTLHKLLATAERAPSGGKRTSSYTNRQVFPYTYVFYGHPDYGKLGSTSTVTLSLDGLNTFLHFEQTGDSYEYTLRDIGKNGTWDKMMFEGLKRTYKNIRGEHRWFDYDAQLVSAVNDGRVVSLEEKGRPSSAFYQAVIRNSSGRRVTLEARNDDGSEYEKSYKLGRWGNVYKMLLHGYPVGPNARRLLRRADWAGYISENVVEIHRGDSKYLIGWGTQGEKIAARYDGNITVVQQRDGLKVFDGRSNTLINNERLKKIESDSGHTADSLLLAHNIRVAELPNRKRRLVFELAGDDVGIILD